MAKDSWVSKIINSIRRKRDVCPRNFLAKHSSLPVSFVRKECQEDAREVDLNLSSSHFFSFPLSSKDSDEMFYCSAGNNSNLWSSLIMPSFITQALTHDKLWIGFVTYQSIISSSSILPFLRVMWTPWYPPFSRSASGFCFTRESGER